MLDNDVRLEEQLILEAVQQVPTVSGLWDEDDIYDFLVQTVDDLLYVDVDFKEAVTIAVEEISLAINYHEREMHEKEHMNWSRI
jgi:hypothetical protein